MGENPLYFMQGEDIPFTGTAETKFPSGQIIEEIPYLNGKITWKYNPIQRIRNS